MARPQKYSDDEILEKLRNHLVVRLGSVYTMHRPSWEGIKKRMAKDENLKVLVEDIVLEANHKWEMIGLRALLNSDAGFNVTLYKHFTQNKKAFLPFETLELEERMQRIEDALEKKN